MTSQSRQLLKNQAKELADIILGSSPNIQSFAAPSFPQGSQGLQLLQGVVTNTPDPGFVDVAFGGSEISIPRLRHLDAYDPDIGDVVWIIRKGADSIVLGALRNIFVVSENLEAPTVVGSGGGAPAFLNTATQLSSGGLRAQFWKDPDGITHLTGIFVCGASTNNNPAFRLPVLYRPYQDCYYTTINANNSNPVKLLVQPDGDVIPIGVANGDQVILNCVCFPSESFDLGRLQPLALANGIRQTAQHAPVVYGPSAFVRDDGWVLLCGAFEAIGNTAAVGGTISLAFCDSEQAPRNGTGIQLCYFQQVGGTHGAQFGRYVWHGSTLSIPGSLSGTEFFSLEGVNFVNMTNFDQWIDWVFSNSWVDYDSALYGKAGLVMDKYDVVHLWGTIKPGGTTTNHFGTVPQGYRRNAAPVAPAMPQAFYRAYGFGTFTGAHKITYTSGHVLDPAGVTHTTADSLSFDGVYWRTDEASDVGYV